MWRLTFCLVITICMTFLTFSQGAELTDKILSFYQEIVKKAFDPTGKGEVLTRDSFAKLLNLMDGNPKYNHAAVDYLFEKYNLGLEIPFTRLHEIVDNIYGDMISDDPYQPQEIHIAMTNKTTEMKVMWVTMSALEKPFVEYQLYNPINGDDLDWDSTTNKRIFRQYAVNYTYSVPQNWWPTFHGQIYETNMINLNNEKQYAYRVGGYDSVNQTTRYSDVFHFKTTPAATSADRTTRVYSVADHGTFMLLGFETIKKMVEKMNTKLGVDRPDFIFSAGDLSYAGLSSSCKALNITSEDEFELIWDLLHIQNQNVAAYIPWMSGNGNHERFYNWSAFTNRYKMPDNKPELPSNGNFWYAFSYGNIRWISLSSEHSLDPTSEQYTFLRAALEDARAKRGQTPWVIVSIHKPLYCSIEGSPSFADRLEDILLEYDVDLTITGHMHAYERVHPVYKGEVSVLPVKQSDGKSGLGRSVDTYYATGKGPVHVMQGHAGGMQFERFLQPAPAWSAVRLANGLYGPNISHDASIEASWRDLVDRKRKNHANGRNVRLNLNDDLNCVDEANAELCSMYADLPLFSTGELKAIDIGDHNISLNYNYSHTYGFGYITAVNRTHMLYEMVPNVDGLWNNDKFWIVKDHQAPSVTV